MPFSAGPPTDETGCQVIEEIVVIGTGRMAPGIAAACLAAGAVVTIAGRDAARARVAAEQAGKDVRSALIKEQTFAGCDLVIETVIEDLNIKRSLFARLEPWLVDDAVIATNTSSLAVDSIASTLRVPERFAAFHFLHPANLTSVVEVVPGTATTSPTTASLAELARRMEKLPLLLHRDYPGFIWNRLQMAMIRECVHLLDEGVADVESIDAAVADGLAPRWLAAGPLATSDLGGSATFRLVAQQLFTRLSTAGASDRLGPGFYRWTDESEAAVTTLRAESLAVGKAMAELRRRVTPGTL
jgi:3-hydroxybutyryl-CoA dehydrogenase